MEKTLRNFREIAARIWCDQDMRNEVMDVTLCDKIAIMMYQTYKVKQFKKNIDNVQEQLNK